MASNNGTMDDNGVVYRQIYAPKEVVTTIMYCKEVIKVHTTDCFGKAVEKDVGHYSCPFLHCKHGPIKMEIGKGFTNGYKHILCRHCDNDEKKVDQLVESFKKNNENAMFAAPIVLPNERARAIYLYLQLIVMKSLPLYIVKNEFFRDFSVKVSYPLGINIITYAMTH